MEALLMKMTMMMVLMMKPSRTKSSCGGDGGDLVGAAAMEAVRRQVSAVMCCGRCWRSAGSPPLYIGLGGASNSPSTNLGSYGNPWSKRGRNR